MIDIHCHILPSLDDGAPALLYDFIKVGVYTQANSGSFSALYGSRSQEAAFRFLEWNFYHFFKDPINPTKKKKTFFIKIPNFSKEQLGR